MPNHFHAFLQLADPPPDKDNVGAHRDARLQRTPKSLGAIVGQFKVALTSRVRRNYQGRKRIIWHRNYYEHVIRDDIELNILHRYIIENPLRWELDRYCSPG
jgi:REP element-mobilizing transposase RayT